MTKSNTKTAAFLQALSPSPPPAPAAQVEAPANDQPKAKPQATGRSGLKHIGGYFDRGDVEKFAILRARLGLDNSQLIKLAVEELYAKHQAKRAFGDA
jgi:hypothetical protein